MQDFRDIVNKLLFDLETNIEINLKILLETLNLFFEDKRVPYQISYKIINQPKTEKAKDKSVTNCCCICEKTFKKQASLVEHVDQSHLGVCWICGVQRGYELQEIIDHNSKEHSTEFPCICQQCGHNFRRNQQYKIHVLKRHGNNSDDTCYQKCTDCNGHFRSWKRLADHLQETGHSTTSQYFCKKCKKKIGASEKLKHKCREKTKTCQICSTTFETRSNMLRHRIRHCKTVKDFVCHQCGAQYYSIDSLKEHCLLAHRLEAEMVHYECHICEKKFRLKRLLKRHVKAHFANGQFNCEPCAKNYKLQAQLDRHNRNTHKLRKRTRKIDQFSFDQNGDVLKVSTNASHRNEKLASQLMSNDKQSPLTFELPPTVFAFEFSDLLPVAQQSVKVLHFLERI